MTYDQTIERLWYCRDAWADRKNEVQASEYEVRRDIWERDQPHEARLLQRTRKITRRKRDADNKN